MPVNLFGWLTPRRTRVDTRPLAMLDTVPLERQPIVEEKLRGALQASVKNGDPTLLALVGSPRFYDRVAVIDAARAAEWQEMGRVQRAFAKAEPSFDPRTRAYSESMRLTLHAALIEHLADPKPRGKRDLFEMFLELHVTAFHENGGWLDNMQIPVGGALEVVEATPFEMVMNAHELLEGTWVTDPATVKAAAWVREARRASVATPAPA